MPWTDAALLLAHGAAIAASVLVFRAALVRSLRTAPGRPSRATTPSPAAAASGGAAAPERPYEEIVAELAELDQSHGSGEVTTEAYEQRRKALLRAARRARAAG